jgi:flagellin-like protein
MKALSGILGLVIVVAIVYLVYSTQFGGEKGSPPPKEQIDLAAVRSDLLSLAQAERRYVATNGTYATLELLRDAGDVQFRGAGRRGYVYSISVDGALHFRITARPGDPTRADWPTLAIDETMQITQDGKEQ